MRWLPRSRCLALQPRQACVVLIGTLSEYGRYKHSQGKQKIDLRLGPSIGVHTYRTPRVYTKNNSCKRWWPSGANDDLTNGLLMQGVPTHKMKLWGVHAMHPANHLAVAGLPRHQGGGWSLIPACLRLSLVTSAPGVGHGHQTENMTKSAI